MNEFNKRIRDAKHLARRCGFSATAEALDKILQDQSVESVNIANDSLYVSLYSEHSRLLLSGD